MVALPQVYKTEDVKTGGGSNNIHVPDGTYIGVILSGEMSKSPFGENKPDDLLLKVAITTGDYKNTIIEHRLGILDMNPIKSTDPEFTWSRAAYGTLGQISDAFGMKNTPKNTDEICNKPIAFTTATRKGMDKSTTPPTPKPEWDNSYIKSYQAVPANGVPTPVTSQAEVKQAEVTPPSGGNPFAKK